MSPQSSPQSCPSCQGAKYTSLPFGNFMGHAGRASTYRCLTCGTFFRLRLEATPNTEDLALSARRAADRVLQRLVATH